MALATLVFLSYAYFYKGNSGDSNQNARFDLTRAITEQHTLRIDAFHQNTASKAFYKGHYFSDKAPGLSLTAVPVWATIHAIAALADVPERNSSEGMTIRLETYFSTLLVVALPTTLAAACLFILAMEFGVPAGGAAFCALAFGLGTPMWSYAILFRSHATVTALLLFAFTAALGARKVQSERKDRLLGAAIGLAGGWATVTEYPAAPAALILAILGVVHVRQSGRAIGPMTEGIAAGGLVCAVVLMSYQYAAFGSPFRVSYAFTTYDVPPPSPEMGNGLFGVTYPRLWIVRELLLGRYRGLFPLAPALILAPIGFVLLWRRGQEFRTSVMAAVLLILYYILFNASYRYWDGGFSNGPRHLAPTLPFLCLGLGLLWTRARPLHRIVLVIVLLYGAFIELMAVSTDPMPGTDIKVPVQELFWPAFRAGNLETTDFGKYLGLKGLLKLLPLFLIWILVATRWLWWERTMGERDHIKCS